ncbi:MAG: siroheme synthase CysG [Amphiplicatus sp.]
MRKPEPAPRPKMAPLPILPVFFKLDNRLVLLAGDGEEAAWKAELLLAAGAILRIAAVHPCKALQELMRAHGDRCIFLNRSWRPNDFDDAALAVGVFSDAGEARKFAATGRVSGAPVNLIDRPEACDFQFGSIVNRSPVVVSISTNGAAPALAQEIRSRIEALLHPAVADWACAAARLRAALARRLPLAKARLAFWRRFADAAFVEASSEIEETIERLLANESDGAGRVTIVGAGPGAAEHLTIQAVRALQSADVILFDDLVSDEVLEFVRREARRIAVGKRGGRRSCRQDDINETMLRLAKQGKRVVRLKSGDPMIFGRAGEEIAALEAAGIAVEIIPGVTAALAAAARLKVSLTHRDEAHGVKFVTAHSRDGALPAIDWRACADPGVTLMVYMGARMAPALARRLLAEGLAPETPAVVAEAVSRPRETFSRTSLAGLLDAEIETGEPVLLGIGTVFRRKEKNMNKNNSINDKTSGLPQSDRMAARRIRA